MKIFNLNIFTNKGLDNFIYNFKTQDPLWKTAKRIPETGKLICFYSHDNVLHCGRVNSSTGILVNDGFYLFNVIKRWAYLQDLVDHIAYDGVWYTKKAYDIQKKEILRLSSLNTTLHAMHKEAIRKNNKLLDTLQIAISALMKYAFQKFTAIHVSDEHEKNVICLPYAADSGMLAKDTLLKIQKNLD